MQDKVIWLAMEIYHLKTVTFNNVSYCNFGLGSNLKKWEGTFGPEVSISNVLSENRPENKYILFKYAVNGSSIYNWTKDTTNINRMQTYAPHLKSLTDSSMSNLEPYLNMDSVEVKCVVWMQGEGDTRVKQLSEQYYKTLSKFMSDFRSELNNDSLPFNWNDKPPKYKYSNIVRAMQKCIADSVLRISIIETNDLSQKEDSVHFSSDDQLIFGRRIGYEILNLDKYD